MEGIWSTGGISQILVRVREKRSTWKTRLNCVRIYFQVNTEHDTETETESALWNSYHWNKSGQHAEIRKKSKSLKIFKFSGNQVFVKKRPHRPAQICTSG